MPLINCETEFDLTWSRNCIIYEISRTVPVAGDNPREPTLTTKVTCQISSYIQLHQTLRKRILDWCPAGSVLPYGEKVHL